ncbi:hypothetical protein MXM41_20740 [Leclercia adecarboxylata]|uniref:hypothetical protein n=1 Tax=Leclercia adecarboxylata TaxID=83655 RepID=UPI002DBD5AFC|nr:hypothetical protein [Leclercia adecarboxylata]MEB6381336.1 hypothetical protein [Leclercia adecarboxylata]
MPFKTAIKWIHRFVTLTLFILVLGFMWLNHQPDPQKGDELQRIYKLSDSVWLYMTVNDKGGATVPIVYRYYLSKEIPGKNREIIHALATHVPFLEGTGTITNASIGSNGEVNISYSGQIFSVQKDISNLRFTILP